jgi:ferredoxin
LSDFGKDCTDCGTCVDACPFLKKYGTPRKIILKRSESFSGARLAAVEMTYKKVKEGYNYYG